MEDLKQRNKNPANTTNFESININEDIADDDDEEEYLRIDPVRKFQFDHNVSTCLTHSWSHLDKFVQF